MDNVLFHRISRYTTQSSNNIEAQVSVPTRKQNLTQLGWVFDNTAYPNLLDRGLNSNFWQMAGGVAMRLNIEGFIDVLAVFVRECRNHFDEVPIMSISIVHMEFNLS